MVILIEKLKDAFTSKKLICTNCGKQIAEGETIIAKITMPSEKEMIVSKLDNAIARTADAVLCQRCH
ncbi:hypothetical protein QMK38_01915 [Lysinibacillus fusiformis]|nr:hypothetical protein [Lysinibacillus fusiformis]